MDKNHGIDGLLGSVMSTLIIEYLFVMCSINILTEMLNERVQNRFELDKNHGVDGFLESVMSNFG